MSPTGPLRFCVEPGCGERVTAGRCARHQQAAGAARRAVQDPRYRSRRWTEYSRRRRGLFPRCAVCGRLDAHVTDHIEPVAANPARFWDPTNHRTLCRSCNRQAADRQLTTVYPEGSDHGPAIA
jgi:5-methylcytosine-specific restriction endonuclease McrA